jgi:hypothetical protein
MVAESTFELEFAPIAAIMTDFKVQIWWSSELHSFCYKKRRHRAIFLLYLRVQRILRFTKIFFRPNNIRRLKKGFLWL